MKPVAFKSKSVIVFPIVILGLVALFSIGFKLVLKETLRQNQLKEFWYVTMFLILIIIFLLCIAIYYLKWVMRPNVLISLDNEYFVFYDGERIAISEIKEVRYNKATARNFTYTFGKITFILNDGNKKVIQHVSSVEDVGTDLHSFVIKYNIK